jgi:hypothetical protein
MNDDKYGEVKVRKNIFPSDAKKIAEKGDVGILITQCKLSKKTKDILDETNITLYEGVEPILVEQLREQIAKEKESKEKKENE